MLLTFDSDEARLPDESHISSRVAPVLQDAVDSGKVNLTAIINTHQ